MGEVNIKKGEWKDTEGEEKKYPWTGPGNPPVDAI